MKMTKNNMMLAVLGLAGATLTFFGFHALYSSDISEYGREFVAGCLGALITIAATAALLRSQTSGEIKKDQISGIFQTKLAIYSQFIEFLNTIHKDAVVTAAERNELVQWGLKLALVASEGVILTVRQYIYQFMLLGSDGIEVLDDKRSYDVFVKHVASEHNIEPDELEDREFMLGFHVGIGSIVSALRDDLLNKELPTESDNMNIQAQLDTLFMLHNAVDVGYEDGEFYLEKMEKKGAKKARAKAKVVAAED